MNRTDTAATLARIAYDGPTSPTLGTLSGLMAAHLYHVPFENLDIHLGREIVLERGRLFDKIVSHRRGGFCYELNGLFADLLSTLGFEVTRHAARVWGDAGYGVELAHMALIVHLGEPHLVDVGFGEGFRAPLRLADGLAQPQTLRAYRVAHEEGSLWRYDAQEDDGEWRPQYRLSETPLALEDFQPGCDYQQHSPDSHFRAGRLCSLARPDGRITLRDDRLIVTQGHAKTETPISGEAEFQAALREDFGVDLP